MTPVDTAKPATAEGSALAPLRHPVFSALWTATVVSNIGTWMQNAAAGWLMTGLTSDALVVARKWRPCCLSCCWGCWPVHWPTSWIGALLIAVNGAQTIGCDARPPGMVWSRDAGSSADFHVPRRGWSGAGSLRRGRPSSPHSCHARTCRRRFLSIAGINISRAGGSRARRHRHRRAWAGGTVLDQRRHHSGRDRGSLWWRSAESSALPSSA